MMMRMMQLSTKKTVNMMTMYTPPTRPVIFRAGPRVMDQRTAESCWWARDRAHRRRYDAVCDTQLRQNSVQGQKS